LKIHVLFVSVKIHLAERNQVNDKIENIPICDYEGSDYRTRFWQNQGREYEDLAERIALRKLLPPPDARRSARLLEIGTGFGRLVDMYRGYREIVLLDYSKSLLQEAQARLGSTAPYTYVAGNIYRLPFAAEQFDTVCMIRVIHHLADVPLALEQIAHVLKPGGTLILEFAGKFHIKSILRYALRRQSWSPFDLQPLEFVKLNFDFHPRWMQQQLQAHGFQIEKRRSLSHLRIAWLKRHVSARLLARLDALLQPTGRWWPCAPSIMVRAVLHPERAPTASSTESPLTFRCPTCGHTTLQKTEEIMHCTHCNAHWPIDHGIYDFKTAIEG